MAEERSADNNWRNGPEQVVFSGYSGNDEYLVIPDDVTVIADDTFSNNKSLRHVDLKNVRYIGARAFQDCSNLESVVMKKIEVIAPMAFDFCLSLKKIDFGGTETAGITEIGESAFYHCNMLDIPKIPETIKRVGPAAFSHTAIRYADLHWLETIPGSLFGYCTSLIYADISSAREIGDDAFAGCRSLADVRYGDIERIGERSFYKCESFRFESLPETLTYIGNDAICNIGEGMVVPQSVRYIGHHCFGEIDKVRSIRLFRSALYEFRNYFCDESQDESEEDRYLYLWKGSIDVSVLDDRTGEESGFLPLFTGLNSCMKGVQIDAFREDNTFDYSVIDTLLFDEMSWSLSGKDRIAVSRYTKPYELTASFRKLYTDYLINHSRRIAKRAIQDNDIGMLVFLYENNMITGDNITGLLDYSSTLAAPECTAYLLECRSELNVKNDPLLEEL